MRFIFGLMSVLLTACSTAQDTPFQHIDSPWQGKTIQALEEAWGAPNMVTTDPNGMQRYTFITKKRVASAEPASANVLATPTATLSTPVTAPPTETISLVKCTTVVEVGNENIIQNVTSKGDLCGDEEFKQKTGIVDSM